MWKDYMWFRVIKMWQTDEFGKGNTSSPSSTDRRKAVCVFHSVFIWHWLCDSARRFALISCTCLDVFLSSYLLLFSYSSLWLITFDPVFRTLCRNSPTCWVWVQAWRSRTLWTLRNTETPLLSWDVWQRNWLVHRSCFLSESKCPTVVVLLSNSFCFPGPASIGLLSPGTLEYLLESLVSKQSQTQQYRWDFFFF